MEHATAPIDTDTMRDHAKRALNEVFDSAEDLDILILALRGHIQLMIPEVEQVIGEHPRDHIPAICARACCGEARRRLVMGNGDTIAVRVSVSQKLARTVDALVRHYTELGGTK